MQPTCRVLRALPFVRERDWVWSRFARFLGFVSFPLCHDDERLQLSVLYPSLLSKGWIGRAGAPPGHTAVHARRGFPSGSNGITRARVRHAWSHGVDVVARGECQRACRPAFRRERVPSVPETFRGVRKGTSTRREVPARDGRRGWTWVSHRDAYARSRGRLPRARAPRARRARRARAP